MSPRSVPAMLARARADGYAVAAINVVDVLTMDGVLDAAARCSSPIIVQAAARTARDLGPEVLAAAFAVLAARHAIPAALGLDHCDDLALIGRCLAAGWDAVLFDGSALPAADNIEATRRVVSLARAHGASVEGELESIRGHELGVASGTGELSPIEDSLAFIDATGIDCFAPSIGNVHGRTSEPPQIDVARAGEIASRGGVPLALHGGTGIDEATLAALISNGCAKVNVSTALREACSDAMRAVLERGGDDPGPALVAMRSAAGSATEDVLHMLGSVGRA